VYLTAIIYFISTISVPRVVPQGFHLINVNDHGTSAKFGWNGVDERPESIQGFFRGYQVCLVYN
jgi:hypothetical protein